MTGRRLQTHFKNGWVVEPKLINGYKSEEHASPKKAKTVTNVMNFNTVILNDKASDVFPELTNIKSSTKYFPDDEFKTVFKQIKNQTKTPNQMEVEFINYFDAEVAKTIRTKEGCTNSDAWNIHAGVITMDTRCFYSVLKFHRCLKENRRFDRRFKDPSFTGIEQFHQRLINKKWGPDTSEGYPQTHEVSINYQNDNWYMSKNASNNRQIGCIGSWLKNSNVKRDVVSLGRKGFRITLEIPNKTSNLLEGKCNRLIIHTKRILGTEKITNAEAESRCLVRIYGNKNLFSEEDNDTKLEFWRYPDETPTFMKEQKKRRIRYSRERRMDRLYKHTSTLFTE